MADHRDTNILIQALLKSIIESGAPQDKWREMLKESIKLHAEFLGAWEAKQQRGAGK